jgi:hypothetical protein
MMDAMNPMFMRAMALRGTPPRPGMQMPMSPAPGGLMPPPMAPPRQGMSGMSGNPGVPVSFAPKPGMGY